MKRLKYSVTREENRGADKLGSALGPDWHKGFSKKVGMILAILPVNKARGGAAGLRPWDQTGTRASAKR